MHFILSLFLILFSSWTITVHIGILFEFKLNNVLVIFPIITLLLITFYKFLKFINSNLLNKSNKLLIQPSIKYTYSQINLLLLFSLALPVILYWSWMAFWISSIAILIISIFDGNNKPITNKLYITRFRKIELITISCIFIIAIILSLIVSRSDLDDAFYASVAAFTSANPETALKMQDPMLGEIGLPLIFPSYQFTSFEILSGLGGYLFSLPAINFYYIYLVPIWMTVSVLVIFLLTKELFPQYWLISGCMAFLLTLLLGEMHRSPANFSFQRIYQGKAVFLSVIVPAIFYLTARYFSNKNNKSVLFLIGCCQISSIGLTNFGMFMGPIVGFTAILSNMILLERGDTKKLVYILLTLLIPLPYLINVALESRISPLLSFNTESAFNVWESVFGPHQQYLIGILLLAGPILAKNSVTRWRLAVPPLILFSIFLNPYFSYFISKYITTPPVYWRVVWSFPILIFTAVSLCMIFTELFNTRFHIITRSLLVLLVLFTGVYAFPFNTLREKNIGNISTFADWKIPKEHLRVSKIAMIYAKNEQRILAPDEIAGVISRFENHPKLISTRGIYLNLMQSSFTPNEFTARTVLYNYITGNIIVDNNNIIKALKELNVSVVVLSKNIETIEHINIMHTTKYSLINVIDGYSIWIKN